MNLLIQMVQQQKPINDKFNKNEKNENDLYIIHNTFFS